MDLALSLHNLKKSFGEFAAVDGVSLDVPKGHIFGLIGPNGAGKTTMFKMIIGTEKPDAGTVEVGSTVQISYVDQNRDFHATLERLGVLHQYAEWPGKHDWPYWRLHAVESLTFLLQHTAP